MYVSVYSQNILKDGTFGVWQTSLQIGNLILKVNGLGFLYYTVTSCSCHSSFFSIFELDFPLN